SKPLRSGLKRLQQKSYPHINGLYLLLRASGLSLTAEEGKQTVLSLDQQALDSWRSLNATERYFTLLEAWLVRGAGEIIGESRDPLGSLFKCSTFMERIPDTGLKVAGDRQAEQSTIPYLIGAYNLALLELFGCVSITEGQPEAGKGWVIARVKQTPFGEALFKLLSQHKLAEMKMLLEETDEDDEAIAFGALQSVLQPYFPEWRNNLSLPEDAPGDSLYIFKVSLDAKTWRRLAIPATLMLDDLSDAILRAFDFDNDHLYEFSYRNRFGKLARIHHPCMEESPTTAETAIGEVPLRPGAAMEYLFDFGDMWRFDVKLEEISPADARVKKPKLLDKRGQSPPQYPNMDEDEW
ncbi:MAG: plasmid pRiA4b ORF-3 family protein, partial [Pyrinomonadaceae bacterium]|nr:plasmid pRiA4b ORF-3 family protein [Pyrinomonadaceae bacterium]